MLFAQAAEKPVQAPNPPPETFSPFSFREAGSKKTLDPAELAAAAEKIAETLRTGSPPDVSSWESERGRGGMFISGCVTGVG